MLTVNSPLRLMNSLVPSSGSTSQKRVAHGTALARAAISSATTGMCGAKAAQAGTMWPSARSSASVTGDASALPRTSKPVRRPP
jgi:hypothetical protein